MRVYVDKMMGEVQEKSDISTEDQIATYEVKKMYKMNHSH